MSFRRGFHRARACALLLLATITVAGCRSGHSPFVQQNPQPINGPNRQLAEAAPVQPLSGTSRASAAPGSIDEPVPTISATSIAQVEFYAPVRLAPAHEPVESEVSNPSELVLGQLVNEVLARNRSLQAMVATWRAATQRYPQAIAFDDPMFNSMTAPASWRSSDVTPAYYVGGSQKIPWMGKRNLRGQVAQFEANASLFVPNQRALPSELPLHRVLATRLSWLQRPMLLLSDRQ